MKTIGVIGGMSWESSAEYYRLLNREAKARLGGHHNASSLMATVDFADVEALQRAGDWATLGTLMADAARQLERGGADIVLLATNTMHRVCASIDAVISIPFLHIADPTGAALRSIDADRAARESAAPLAVRRSFRIFPLVSWMVLHAAHAGALRRTRCTLVARQIACAVFDAPNGSTRCLLQCRKRASFS